MLSWWSAKDMCLYLVTASPSQILYFMHGNSVTLATNWNISCCHLWTILPFQWNTDKFTSSIFAIDNSLPELELTFNHSTEKFLCFFPRKESENSDDIDSSRVFRQQFHSHKSRLTKSSHPCFKTSCIWTVQLILWAKARSELSSWSQT